MINAFFITLHQVHGVIGILVSRKRVLKSDPVFLMVASSERHPPLGTRFNADNQGRVSYREGESLPPLPKEKFPPLGKWLTLQ